MVAFHRAVVSIAARRVVTSGWSSTRWNPGFGVVSTGPIIAALH